MSVLLSPIHSHISPALEGNVIYYENFTSHPYLNTRFSFYKKTIILHEPKLS